MGRANTSYNRLKGNRAPPGKRTVKYITDPQRRASAATNLRQTIMRKMNELEIKCGTQMLVAFLSPSRRLKTFSYGPKNFPKHKQRFDELCYLVFSDARDPSFEDLKDCSRDELRSIYRSLIQNLHGGKIPNCGDKKMCPEWMTIDLWHPIERMTPSELRRAIKLASKFKMKTTANEEKDTIQDSTFQDHSTSPAPHAESPKECEPCCSTPKLDLELTKPRKSERLAQKAKSMPTRIPEGSAANVTSQTSTANEIEGLPKESAENLTAEVKIPGKTLSGSKRRLSRSCGNASKEVSNAEEALNVAKKDVHQPANRGSRRSFATTVKNGEDKPTMANDLPPALGPSEHGKKASLSSLHSFRPAKIRFDDVGQGPSALSSWNDKNSNSNGSISHFLKFSPDNGKPSLLDTGSSPLKRRRMEESTTQALTPLENELLAKRHAPRLFSSSFDLDGWILDNKARSAPSTGMGRTGTGYSPTLSEDLILEGPFDMSMKEGQRMTPAQTEMLLEKLRLDQGW